MRLDRFRRHPDRRVAGEALLGELLTRGGRRFLARRSAPSVRELAHASGGLVTDVRQLLAGEPGAGDGRLDELAAEHDDLLAELDERTRAAELPHPSGWAVEDRTSLLVYALVRLRRPETVVEVGVANGHSSAVVARAMRLNDAGRLHSFDVVHDAGALVPPPDRARWDLQRVGPRRPLAHALEQLPAADLAIHDADHDYLAQSHELDLLWDRLRPGGVVVLDDADASRALIDFAARRGVVPRVLLERTKAVGVVERPA